MDQYDYNSDSDRSDFDRFHSQDIEFGVTGHNPLTLDPDQLSEILSVSLVDTSSDSSSDTELHSIDVVENPPSWTNENLRPFNTPFSNL